MRAPFVPLLMLLSALMLCAGQSPAQSPVPTEIDGFLWLEDAQSDSALNWVKARNELTLKAFANDSMYLNIQEEVLAILDSKDRIPYGTLEGEDVYSFWQDGAHIKGIIRRTPLEEYVRQDPQWETVLDIDSLSAREGKDYAYSGTVDLPPGRTRGLIVLSIGGRDAAVYREFDYRTKSFVEGGFSLPEAKSRVTWYDSSTLLVGTDFGPGSMTTSGYPRILKMWKRGTPLSEATTLLEGEPDDIAVAGYVSFRPEGKTCILSRSITFWESIDWLMDSSGSRTLAPYPSDAYVYPFRDMLLIQLNSKWLGVPEGSLVTLAVADLQSPDLSGKLDVIFRPDDRTVLTGVTVIREHILATVLENVRAKTFYYWPEDSSGVIKWNRGQIDLPDMGSTEIRSASAYSDILMISYDDFLTPTKLYLLEDPAATPREIKSLPESFHAGGLKVEQFFATSKDGTSIPYFLVSPKNMALDGANPTLLYGYGGFRAAELPYYSRSLGKIWFARGGVYALANIRGGGEFGPRWHKAGLLENRQRVFDDFIAIGEDLCRRNVTSPAHLGIMGGSNGGLLVGACFVQRPELFKAVVCQVPLLDMLRYTKIGAGASWMAEYGDPEVPEQRAFIEKYSPYQNLRSGVAYPEVFLQTSTADDRVHPAHARKMAARMEQLGCKTYYYEELSGGHAAGIDNKQRARVIALEWAYLWRMLR